MTKRKLALLMILLSLIFFLAGVICGQTVLQNNRARVAKPTPQATPTIKVEEGVFCTMEAKLCPDGSYVGRQPPNCEFAPCPGEKGYVSPLPTRPEPTLKNTSPGGAAGGM